MAAMADVWKTLLWRQFGAAIDMLDNALRECPDELWTGILWGDNSAAEDSPFWYVAYHTLFWLDYYLSGSSDSFAPPPPFTLSELDPAGVLPDRTYTRPQLRDYLLHGRRKCRASIESLTEEQGQRMRRVGRGQLPFAELLLYTMRHVQEHAAQLSMFLGQRAGLTSGWVAVANAT
jgi:DinB superfamily